MVRFPRQARWAVPAGVVAVVAAAVAGSLMSVAQAAPGLPARTPGQLLAAAAGARTPPPPLSGTVTETANLGVPQLPGQNLQSSLTSLLAGSHTIRVWYGGPGQFRLALPVPLGETDLVRDGGALWLWQSASDSATQLPAPSGPGAGPPEPSPAPLTPAQAAQQALAAAGPSTAVRVDGNLTVAGVPAYQLVLAPKDGRSLIGQIRIALDARHPQLPLQVAVYAKGADSPAFQIGYTSLSLGAQPASVFHFTPPPGASVRRAAPAQRTGWYAYAPLTGQARPGPAGLNSPRVVGHGWLTVVAFPASALSGLAHGSGAAGLASGAARSASGDGGGVSAAAVLAALLQAATPVHGHWGAGKLVHTSLLNLLITSRGQVLAGAVAPQVLYHAAAAIR